MDIVLGGLVVSESLRTVSSKFPHIRILILSMCTDMELLSDLLDAGIHGYTVSGRGPDLPEYAFYRGTLLEQAKQFQVYPERTFGSPLRPGEKNPANDIGRKKQ